MPCDPHAVRRALVAAASVSLVSLVSLAAAPARADAPAEPAPRAAEVTLEQEHPGPAAHHAAADHERTAAHEDAHEEHHRFIAGLNGMALGAIAHGHALAEGGAGGFMGFVAVPGWLELEVSAHYLRTAEHSNELPVDLVLKKPFHPARWFHPYLGLGPTIVPSWGSEKMVRVGLATEAGTVFWVNPEIGISAEVDYNLVGRGGLVQEVAGTSGVVFAF